MPLANVHLSGHRHLRVVVRLDIPAITRNVAEDIAAGMQEFPEFVRSSHVAGIAAAHTDHGDGFTRLLAIVAHGKLRAKACDLGVGFFEGKWSGWPRPRLFRHALLLS